MSGVKIRGDRKNWKAVQNADIWRPRGRDEAGELNVRWFFASTKVDDPSYKSSEGAFTQLGRGWLVNRFKAGPGIG